MASSQQLLSLLRPLSFLGWLLRHHCGPVALDRAARRVGLSAGPATTSTTAHTTHTSCQAEEPACAAAAPCCPWGSSGGRKMPGSQPAAAKKTISAKKTMQMLLVLSRHEERSFSSRRAPPRADWRMLLLHLARHSMPASSGAAASCCLAAVLHHHQRTCGSANARRTSTRVVPVASPSSKGHLLLVHPADTSLMFAAGRIPRRRLRAAAAATAPAPLPGAGKAGGELREMALCRLVAWWSQAFFSRHCRRCLVRCTRATTSSGRERAHNWGGERTPNRRSMQAAAVSHRRHLAGMPRHHCHAQKEAQPRGWRAKKAATDSTRR